MRVKEINSDPRIADLSLRRHHASLNDVEDSTISPVGDEEQVVVSPVATATTNMGSFQAPSNIRTGSVYSNADTNGSALLRDSNGPPMLPPEVSKGQVAHNGDVTDPVLSRIRSAVDANVGNDDVHIQYPADHSQVEATTGKHYASLAPLCGSLPPSSLSHAQQLRHNSLPLAYVRAPASRRSSMSALCPSSVSVPDNGAFTPASSAQASTASGYPHTLAHPSVALPFVGSLANPDTATFTTVTPPLTTIPMATHFLGTVAAGSPPNVPSSRTHASSLGLPSPPRQSPPASAHASPEGVPAVRSRRPPTPCLPLPVIAHSDSAQHSTAGESVASDTQHPPASHVSTASSHASHNGYTAKIVASSTSSMPPLASAPLPTMPTVPATLPVLPQRGATLPQASFATSNLASPRLAPSRRGSQPVSAAPGLAMVAAAAHEATQPSVRTHADASPFTHPNMPLPLAPHHVQVSPESLPAAISTTYAATCSRSVFTDTMNSIATVSAAPRESTVTLDAYAMYARMSDHATLASPTTCSLQSIELEGLRSSAPLSHAPAAHPSAAFCAPVAASVAAPGAATAPFSHAQTAPQQFASMARPLDTYATHSTALRQVHQSFAAVPQPAMTQPHPPADPTPFGLRSSGVQVALTAVSGSTTLPLPQTARALPSPASSSAQQEQGISDLAAATQAYSAIHISSQNPHQQQLMAQAHAQADAQLQAQMQQWHAAHACVGIVDATQFSAPATNYPSSVANSAPRSHLQLQLLQQQGQLQTPYQPSAPSQSYSELRPLPLPVQSSGSSFRVAAPTSAPGPGPMTPFPGSPSFRASSPYTYLPTTTPAPSPLSFPAPYPASTSGSFLYSSPVASHLVLSAAPSPLASLAPYAQSVNFACMPASASPSCDTFRQDALASSLPSSSPLNRPPAFCTPTPSPQPQCPPHAFTPQPQMHSPLTLASPRKVLAQHVSFSASVATDVSNPISTPSVPPTESTQLAQQLRTAVTPARAQLAPSPAQLQPNAQSEPSARYRRMSMTGFAPVRPFAPSVSSTANPPLTATVPSAVPYTASITASATASTAAVSSAASPTAEERDSAASAVSALITGSEHMALSSLSPTKERTLVQAAATPARTASTPTTEPATVALIPHPPAHPRTSFTPVPPSMGSPMRRGTTPGRTNTCPGSSPTRSPERPIGPSARPLRTLTSPVLPTARVTPSQTATTPSLHTSGPSATASPVAADTTTDATESLLSSPDASPAAQPATPQMLVPSPPALPPSKTAFRFSPMHRLKRNSAPAQMNSPFMEALPLHSVEDAEKPCNEAAASSERALAKDAHELLVEAHDRSVTVDGTLPTPAPEQVPEGESALTPPRRAAAATTTAAPPSVAPTPPAPSSTATQTKTTSRRARALPHGVDARTVHRVHASLDAALDEVPQQFCIVAPPFRSYRRSTIIAHNDNRAILGGHVLLLDEPEWVSGRGPHWDLAQLCHTIAADDADMLLRYLAEGLSPHTLLGRVRYFVPTRAYTSNSKVMPAKKPAKPAPLPMLPDEEDDVGVSVFPEFSSPRQAACVKDETSMARGAATGGLAAPSMVRVMSMPSVPALAVDSVDIDALNDVDAVNASSRILSTPQPCKSASLTAPTNTTRAQRVMSFSGSEKSESKLRSVERDGWVYEYPAAREVLPCATPLLLAIGWGALRCLKAMLNAGVDVNYMPKGTDAPPLLHLALYCNVIDEGDDLVFSPLPSDSDAQSPSEDTAAEKPVATCIVNKPHERRLDILHVLMAHGADASYATPRQWTFAHALLILGDIRLLYHFYDQYGYTSPGCLIASSTAAQGAQHSLEVREGDTANPYIMHVLSTVSLPECPRSPSYCIFHRYFFLACAMLFQSMDVHAQVPQSVPTVALRVACMCAEMLTVRAAATESRHDCLVFTMEDLVKLVEHAKESDIDEPVDNVSEALQDKQSIVRNLRRTRFDCDFVDDSSIGGSSCCHTAERAQSKDARSTASKPLVVGVPLPPQPVPRPATSAAPAHRSRRRSDADLPPASVVTASALAENVRERERAARVDRQPSTRDVRDVDEAKEFVADRGAATRTQAREARESHKKDKKDKKDRRDVITSVQDAQDDRVRGRQEEQAPRLIKVGEGRPALDPKALRELREMREARDGRDIRGASDARDVQDKRAFQQASPARVEGRRPMPPRVERDTNRSRDPREPRAANAGNPSAHGDLPPAASRTAGDSVRDMKVPTYPQTNARRSRPPVQCIAVHATPLIRFQREVGELTHRHQEMREREGRESLRDALFPPRESEIARDSRMLASAQPPHRRLQLTRRGTVHQGIHPSPYQLSLRGRMESDSTDNRYLTVPSHDSNHLHLGTQTPSIAGKTGMAASPNVSFSQLPQRAAFEAVPMIDDFAFEVEDAQRFVSSYQRMSTDPSGIAPPLPMTIPRARSRRGSQEMPRTPDRTHAAMERSSPPHPFRGRASPAANTGAPRPQLGPGPSRMPTRSDTAYSSGQPRGK